MTLSPPAPAVGLGRRAAPYWRLMVAGLRQQSAYVVAALGGLVANVTFGFLKAAILTATVAAAGGTLAGYDQAQMLSFVWIGQAMLGLVNLMGRDVLSERIKSGDIVVDFLRPVDLQLSGLSTFLGQRLFTLLPRGLPTLLIGVLVTGMAVPSGLTPLLLGPLSVLLGMSLSYLLVYALSMIGLWLVEIRGLQTLFMVFGGFFSGLYLPVAIFPGWLQTVAEATPFPSVLMTPINVLSGRVTGPSALVAVAVQIGWIVVVSLAGRLLTRAGRRRMEVQGG